MAEQGAPTYSTIVSNAEALAGRRGEAISTVHVLVALASLGSTASDVLTDRGASARRLLDAFERSPGGLAGDLLPQFSARVRDSARRFGARVPTGLHALLVILGEKQWAAHRLLEQAGLDLAQTRSSVIQALQGLPMRAPRPTAAPLSPFAPSARPLRGNLPATLAAPGALGTVVPLVPPVGKPVVAASKGTLQAVPLVPPEVTSRPLARRRSVPPAPAVAPSPPPAAVSELSADKIASPETRNSGRVSDISGDMESERLLGRFALPKKRFPILATVGRNLTDLAERGLLDQVVGRDAEIEEVLDVLAKRQANNPCLVGPVGVGKTSVVRGVASQIVMGGGGSHLDDRIVIEIPISDLIAGTGVRGALAGRLAALRKEVELSEGRVVLFFDEIHQLFLGDGAEEIASDLKQALARGELPCIGATTSEEFRRIVEKDSALARRFSTVLVDEPTQEKAYLMLTAAAERLARHHKVPFDEEAVALAITWSVRYLPGRCLPDKAISVLDLAGARAQRRGREWVDPESVAEVVAAQANMPIERLLEADSERMLKLEHTFGERVIGHEGQMAKIARILRRNAAGLGSKRPIGTFLLLGPTGVGKTETAKAIAEVMFQSESAMTRIDMAELSEAHAVAKLVGAPPGYVGHEAGGQLTEAVRRRPYQVVLLDEIEKAHPEVLTAFLAVLDEGRMTDSRGRLVDFTNTVIVLTSNLGAREALQRPEKRVGFGSAPQEADGKVEERVLEVAKKALPPELYNRLDEVLVFAPLSRSAVMRIGHKLAAQLAQEIFDSRGIHLSLTDAALEHLLDIGGFDPELGARPLRRQLARSIEAPLAEAILNGKVTAADMYTVDFAQGALYVRILPHRSTNAAE